jgi:hypothetical protein
LTFAERLQEQLSDFALLGIIFLAVFPAFMLDTIRFSNRFVGPISRLRRHLIELSQDGETSDISFRDNDFWQTVAVEFNHVNARFRAQQQEIELLRGQLSAAEETTVV